MIFGNSSIIRKLAKNLFCSFAVSGVSIFWAFERSQVIVFPIQHNLGCVSAIQNSNSLRQLAIQYVSTILRILTACCRSQIQSFVIQSITVDMVDQGNLLIRHHFPDDAMRVVLDSVDGDDPIGVSTKSSYCSSHRARKRRIPSFSIAFLPEVSVWPSMPSQRSGLWVIRKALAQILCVWQNFDSHAVLLAGRWLEAAIPVARGRRLVRFSRCFCFSQPHPGVFS